MSGNSYLYTFVTESIKYPSICFDKHEYNTQYHNTYNLTDLLWPTFFFNFQSIMVQSCKTDKVHDSVRDTQNRIEHYTELKYSLWIKLLNECVSLILFHRPLSIVSLDNYYIQQNIWDPPRYPHECTTYRERISHSWQCAMGVRDFSTLLFPKFHWDQSVVTPSLI